MKKYTFLLLLFFSIVLTGCCILRDGQFSSGEISPIDYGLLEAKTGIDRYWVLYNTHQEAVTSGKKVNYKGIKDIEIEIPTDAKSIPLLHDNDFSGVEIKVLNNGTNINLFTFVRTPVQISVNKSDIDNGVFDNYPHLNKGKVLLVIEDSKPWVENRQGYSYGHTRKDILLLNNGRAMNQTIMPYNNDASMPDCSYYYDAAFSLSNITLTRETGSTYKTFLFYIKGFNNVHLEGISINTPESDLVADAVMRIYDCTNVSIKDISINGTYSRSDYSGYAFTLNNIWSLYVNNLKVKANWSAFGTNNVQSVIIENSNTNTFDIHCYGRDVEFRDVNFSGRFVQLTSVFGDVKFYNCSFTDARILTNGISYNAYVGYDLFIENCTFNAIPGKRIVFDFGQLDNNINSRPELNQRCLPNIFIKNLTINVLEEISEVYLMFFRTSGEFTRNIDYMSTLVLDGVTYNYNSNIKTPASLYISNVPLQIDSPVEITLKDIDLIGNSTVNKQGRGRVLSNLQLKSPKSVMHTSNIRAQSID